MDVGDPPQNSTLPGDGGGCTFPLEKVLHCGMVCPSWGLCWDPFRTSWGWAPPSRSKVVTLKLKDLTYQEALSWFSAAPVSGSSSHAVSDDPFYQSVGHNTGTGSPFVLCGPPCAVSHPFVYRNDGHSDRKDVSFPWFHPRTSQNGSLGALREQLCSHRSACTLYRWGHLQWQSAWPHDAYNPAWCCSASHILHTWRPPC